MKMASRFLNVKTALTACLLLLGATAANAANLVDIGFSALPGDVTEVRLSFDEEAPQISGYTIEKPARIAIDMPNVQSSLKSRRFDIGSGNANSATIVSTKERSRLVINLAKAVNYTTHIEGKDIVLRIGRAEADKEFKDPAQAAEPTVATTKRTAGIPDMRIVNIDFRRGDLGEGQVLIMLNDARANASIQKEGRRIVAEFDNVNLPANLNRRLDVTDFATPVQFIDSNKQGGKTKIIVEPLNDDFEFMSYQTDKLIAINVSKPTASKKKEQENKFPFTGEKLTLNFQNIEVRAVLQLIADFTGLNLVASDSVNGSITLRLQNVPWDQALDLVLKTKGLGKRQMGSVVLIAPTQEISERERVELEAVRQVEELSQLQTEYVQLKYAKATTISQLLTSEQGLLSERGTAVVDERTNTLLMKDTAGNLEKIREVINMLDVPVRQVLIEARIVIAATTVGKELGVKWGGGGYKNHGSKMTTWGGSQQTIVEGNQILFNRGQGTNDPSVLNLEGSNMVNFGATAANASSFAIGYQTADYILDLELSAIETDGKAEIVSQPRVITADGQTASIESGKEIPYQEASSSGATSVSFKPAVLKLEVTPQITPDDRIIMDLSINQDSIGEWTATGVPTIDTNSVRTQVLVDNGETVVLGGIFRSEEIRNISKTPFFGDLPLIGWLFRHSNHSSEKNELLVFITPRLVKDSLTSN